MVNVCYHISSLFLHIGFSRIYADLVKDEKSNSSHIETSPPIMCTNSAHVTNHSCGSVEEKDTLFSTQDKEILSVLEELEETAHVSAINKTRLSGYFFSETVFNLSRMVSTEIEIKILIQNKIKELELKHNFEEFGVLNSISIMNLLRKLVLRLLLIPNLRGNHLTAVLVCN